MDEPELTRRLRAGWAADPPDLTRAAAGAGLLDVAYATIESPVGELLLALTPVGLVRLAYLGPGERDAVLAALARRVSPRMLAAPRALDPVRRELEGYFGGRVQRFGIPLDWTLTTGFGRRVLQATAEIPYGATASYAQVAGRAGNPRAFRAAGNALGANPLPIVVPCHRVLHSDGELGGYTGGVERKRVLLDVEGVRV